jgi:hypothetical protein
VTDNLLLFFLALLFHLQGGALDTVSKGETVVHVPGSTETRHLTGFTGSAGGQLPSNEELADKLRDTVVS